MGDRRHNTRSTASSQEHTSQQSGPNPDNLLSNPPHTLTMSGQDATAAVTPPPPETLQTITQALSGLRVASKKPELPAFDPKNLDLWVKRVENAYIRSNISDPRDKFAFLETKFPVDSDPCITEFLFGEQTQPRWDEFILYLHNRYGRSKKQQASFILDGVKRDGMLPSQMLSFIKEKIGDLTMDELIKEMVVKELPPPLQRVIHDQVKDVSGSEAAKIADSFFDKDGRPLHSTSSPSVSFVEEPCPGLIDTEDEDETPVNAVAKKSRQRGRYPPSTRSKVTSEGFTQAFSPKPKIQSGDKPQARSQSSNRSWVCKYHQRFGNEAIKCEAGCSRSPPKPSPKEQPGKRA